MILYFSGTGNSRYIGEVINTIVDDEIISINDYLKKGMTLKASQSNTYIIVCPTYAWRIPRVVEQFIKDSHLFSDSKIYFIMTCASSVGNAEKYLKALAKAKNLQYCGVGKVIMPENYITMFKAPEKSREIIKSGIEQALKLALIIKAQKLFQQPKITMIDRFSSSFINFLFYPLFVKAKGFYYTDKCIGCNLCVTRCPLNNITLIDHYPFWQDHCSQCMACIGGCPKQAIEYNRKTQGKKRYYLAGHYQKDEL